MEPVFALETMNEGHDGSGLGLTLKDLGGEFESLKKYPIISGICSNKGLSVLEVLDAVDRHTNMPLKRVMEGRRAGDPAELVAGNAKLVETLDWRPQNDDIDVIVGDALAWERKLANRVG
jgi:UDP-glucose 4-epimerase